MIALPGVDSGKSLSDGPRGVGMAYAFTTRYPAVLPGLRKITNDTVIDGELIALGKDGRPSFNALQNSTSVNTAVLYFVFDVMVLNGRDLKGEPLEVPSRPARTKNHPDAR